jgi:3-dehydroquinate synthase
MTRVCVPLSGREYPVLIGGGLLECGGELLAERIAPCRVCLVSDETVFALYGASAEASLRRAGFLPIGFTFPAGERSKRMDTLARLLEHMAESGLDRGDAVLSLGGGVAGDLAGFAAAVYLRGVRVAHMPTTLLSMADSAVGGKTGVDLRAGKNLAGAFWQPELVICDTDTLSTLPPREYAAGMAEVIKYGAALDAEIFPLLARHAEADALRELLARCVRLKAELTAEDERDLGRRRLLNFGHTVGHALERISGYALRHGEAVSIGMSAVTRGCERLGLTRHGQTGRLERALRSFGLPTDTEYAAAEIYSAALSDKKIRGGTLTLAVMAELGRGELRELRTDALRELLERGLE